MEMLEIMTGLMREQKFHSTPKDQEEEEVIDKKAWFDELDLLTRFNANNVGQIVTVRPRLVKKQTG